MSYTNAGRDDSDQNGLEHEHYDTLHRAAIMLQSMGSGRPKSKDKLVNALQHLGKVLKVANPLSILATCVFYIEGQTMSVVVTETLKTSIGIDTLNKHIWNAVKKRAQNTGAMVILAEPDSDLQQQIKKTTEVMLEKEYLKGKSKPEIINEIVKASFIEQKVSSTDAIDKVIASLVDCGYLVLTEETEKTRVKYNLPSDFMLLSIRHLADEYQRELQNLFQDVNSACKKVEILQFLITVVNDCLNKMKLNLKDICKPADQSLTSGVYSLYHRRQHSTRIPLYERDYQNRWSSSSNMTKFLSYFNVDYVPTVTPGVSRWDLTPGLSRWDMTPPTHHARNNRKTRRRWSTSSSDRSSSNSGSPSTGEIPKSPMTSRFKDDGTDEPYAYKSEAMDEDIKPVQVDPGLMLESLCQQIDKLTVADITQIPTSLTPEALALINVLEKMGKGKPKYLTALRNVAKLACCYIYTWPLISKKAGTKNPVRENHENRKQTQHGRKIASPRQNQSFQLRSEVRNEEVELDPVKMFSSSTKKSFPHEPGKEKCQCRRCKFNFALENMAQEIKMQAQKHSAEVTVADMQTRRQIVINLVKWMKNLPTSKKLVKNGAEQMDTTDRCEEADTAGTLSTKSLFDQLVRKCYILTTISTTDIVNGLAFNGFLSHDGKNITYNIGQEQLNNLLVKSARNKIYVFKTELKHTDVDTDIRTGLRGKRRKGARIPIRGKRTGGGRKGRGTKRMRYN